LTAHLALAHFLTLASLTPTLAYLAAALALTVKNTANKAIVILIIFFIIIILYTSKLPNPIKKVYHIFLFYQENFATRGQRVARPDKLGRLSLNHP